MQYRLLKTQFNPVQPHLPASGYCNVTNMICNAMFVQCRSEPTYVSWLARCLIMSGKPAAAWHAMSLLHTQSRRVQPSGYRYVNNVCNAMFGAMQV
jgi:hypothetical protein